MALQPNTSESPQSIEIPNTVICCAFCSNELKDPKLLSCYHSACTQCLPGRSANVQTELLCPVCDTSTPWPRQQGAAGLVKNNVYDAIKDQLAFGDPQLCLICSSVDSKSTIAECKCIDCGDCLCRRCVKIHKVSGAAKGHRIYDISEIKSGRYHSEIKSLRLEPCKSHHGNSLGYYCIQCNIPECKDGLLSQAHRGHDNVTINQLSKAFKNKLTPSTDAMREKKHNKVMNAEFIERKLKFLEQRRDENRDHIISTVEQLHEEIAALGERRLQEIDQHYEGEIENIKTLLDRQQKQIHHIEATDNLVQGAIQYLPDTKYYFMHKTFANKIDTMVRPDPFEYASASSLSINSRMDLLPKVMGMFAKTVSYGDTVSEFETKDMGTVTNIAITADDEIVAVSESTAKIFNIDGNVLSSLPPDCVKHPGGVAAFNTNIYLTDRAPEKRSFHIFDKTWASLGQIKLPQEEQAFGGVLDVAVHPQGFVYISSASTGTIYVWQQSTGTLGKIQANHLDVPRYMCFRPATNEIIISCCPEEQLKTFSANGQFKSQYPMPSNSEYNLSLPQGICCDKMGFIFAADYERDQLHLVSPSGNFVGHPTACKVFKKPMDVAITQDGFLAVAHSGGISVINFMYNFQ